MSVQNQVILLRFILGFDSLAVTPSLLSFSLLW
jgi:hypothetical protein